MFRSRCPRTEAHARSYCLRCLKCATCCRCEEETEPEAYEVGGMTVLPGKVDDQHIADRIEALEGAATLKPDERRMLQVYRAMRDARLDPKLQITSRPGGGALTQEHS